MRRAQPGGGQERKRPLRRRSADFSKAPVSLSGIVVASAPSILAAPKDRFAALLPVVPTARRDFRRTDRAAAFLRVYQRTKGAAAPVAVSARIVDAAGANAFETTETIRADQFNAARAADYGIQLEFISG